MFDDAFRILLCTCHSTDIYRGGEKIMGHAKIVTHLHKTKKNYPFSLAGWSLVHAVSSIEVVLALISVSFLCY